jgi:hypothetical protein
MATDHDVRRTAGSLIGTYGENAPLYAMQSVDQLIERGDLDRAAQWRRVWHAAEELLRRRPATLAALN